VLGDHADEVVARLRAILEREDPRLVYLPHEGEEHPDHKATLPIVRRVLLGRAAPPVLAAYEVWTPLPGYDEVKDVSAVMDRKLEAIRCYRSQVTYYRYDRAAQGLGQYRGALAGRCHYAEVFRHVALTAEQ
jgi:LmbE family N-acetylglucosaminyl deacetylase